MVRDSRILLFDPATGGHHEDYVCLAAEVLRSEFGVATLAAVPAKARISGSEDLERFEIAPEAASSIRRSISELRRAVRVVNPGAVLHLFADRDLAALAVGRNLGAPCSLLLFRPRSHYPRAFGSKLRPRETVIGWGFESSLRLWMMRSGHNSIMTLDPFAAEAWTERFGSRAAWWPEPPSISIGSGVGDARKDFDVLLFGSITERKGVGALCAALNFTKRVTSVRFAGPVQEGFSAQFAAALEGPKKRGIEIQVENRWISDEEVPGLLARARVSAIPYPRHFGMSRVLLEASATGTPVVGNEFGLVGRLIDDYRLGISVNTNDPHEFASALDRCIEAGAEPYSDLQSEFVAKHGRNAFVDSMKSVARMVE